MNQDEDLESMTPDELVQEASHLRGRIRLHMLEEGHGRCWVDDAALYSVLPEGDQSKKNLPNSVEFFHNCGLYAKSCLEAGHFPEFGTDPQSYFEAFAARCAHYWVNRQEGTPNDRNLCMVPSEPGDERTVGKQGDHPRDLPGVSEEDGDGSEKRTSPGGE